MIAIAAATVGLSSAAIAQSGAAPSGNNNAAQVPASAAPIGADASEANKPANPTPVIDAEAAAGPADEIVVTGTAIRGVAPIGSNLVSVGQETIQKTAAVNVSQLVNTVPSITTSGSLAQGENAYSYYSPQIHSLAGSSSNTTLVIVDGLRLPGGGTQFNQTDPNIIPTSAIQRVEVLADGASSVYGSDAVAGVVNFITRRTFDGLEVNARYGHADNYNVQDYNFIVGKKWDTGGVYLAGQFSKGSTLNNSDRSFSSLGDYRPIGGSNTNSFQCSPATIAVTGVAAGTGTAPSGIFLSPSATTTVANNGNNAPCNNSVYAILVPSQYRANALIRLTNDFGDHLSVTGTLNYNNQKTRAKAAPGGISSTNAYINGTVVPTLNAAGQIVQLNRGNPFFTAPAGAPNATVEQVNWLALRDDGNYGSVQSEEDVIYATATADYKIDDNWTITLADALGKNRSALNNVGTFCTACATLALNGTAQTSGSTTTTDIAGQNVIALNLPLTTANALDVWNGGSANRTSTAVLRSLYGSNTENTNYNVQNQTRLSLQGSLFKLPAGDLKIAVGGEYLWQQQTQKLSGSDNTGPTTTGATFRVYHYRRNVKSAFGEAYVPVISPDMNVPLIYKIDLSISGRYDKYNDVGDTFNPKFAANWEVFEGIKLRANYSRAFVAPPLAVIGDPSQGYLYASGSVGTQGSIQVPVANYPSARQIPGAVIQNTSTSCASATDGQVCTVGSGTVVGLRRQLGGGFTNEVPQKGRSWSAGLDLAPRFLPGFVSAVTFFHNKFIGGVSSPSPTAIVNSAGLRNLLTLCPPTTASPTGCTQDQINTFANLANGASISGAVPANVYFLLDQSSRNALNLTVEGIDYQVTYRRRIGEIGAFTIATSGTYFTKFHQNFGGGTDFSILNTSGYNTTFPSVQFKNRAQFGWELGGISADLFWNYTGKYKNYIATSVIPVTVNSIGNPIGGGDPVKANNTFDLHIAYEFQQEGFFKGWQIYVDGNNIFDKKPPFYNGNTNGVLGGAFGYNGFVSNPVGRLLSIGLRAKL